MENIGKKYSDADFLVEFNKNNSLNIGDNVLKIFRAEMRKKGLLQDRERLEDSHFGIFKNIVDLKNSQNLRWQEAAEKAVSSIIPHKSIDKNNAVNLLSRIDITDDFEANAFDAFCEIAKQYDFDVEKFLNLQAAITDEFSKLPFAKITRYKINDFFQDMMHLAISNMYVLNQKTK